ncbi:DNA repair protein rad52 [Tulasnella sp. 427]|nr:DNA repair protein rad52 [Tulasnella sp. 427]
MNYSANPNTSFNPNMSFGGGGFGQGSFWMGSQDVSEATAQQIASLQAKLDRKLGPEYISTRAGMKLTYVEGWKAINLANEVFGFHGWSSSITSLTVDFIDYNEQSQRYNVGVTAIVRVTLRDGVYHEDVGYGVLENTKQKGPALDKCKKEAVTDGIKRALRNFGNVLGNCLYDKRYTSEVVKIKVPPPKFDKSQLHRRPEFDDSPQPQAGPPNIPAQGPSPSTATGAVQARAHTSAPVRPSPLAQCTTNVPPAQGQAPERLAAVAPPPVPLPPAPLPATGSKGKEKEAAKAIEELGEPEASSTQQYFGSDDDEEAFANFEVGVEEGCMEEESAFLAVGGDGMDVESNEGSAKGAEGMEVNTAPATVVPKAPSGSGGGSARAANSRLEMMRQAIAESNAGVPGIKGGGAGSAGNGPGGGGRVHSVGGFHFPEGMVSSCEF